MTRRTIHFSDLTTRPILDDADVVRVVVIDHPGLDGEAVEFEAAASELTEIDKGALDVAVIELHPAGEQPPRRLVLDAAAFDALALDRPMAELLAGATPVRPNGRAERAPASRVNYATLEHAGTPHKGRVTEAEARLVRENLDIVNARLVASGQRAIDPADPAMRERYGFGVPEDAAVDGAVDGAKDAADGAQEPKDAAASPAGEATSSEHAAEAAEPAEPKATTSAQRGGAGRSAGHRRSSADSTKSAAGAASA